MPYILICIRLLSFPHMAWLFMTSLEYELLGHEWRTDWLNSNINHERSCISLAGQRLNKALYEENCCDITLYPLSLTFIFVKQPVSRRLRQLCAAVSWQYITLTPLHMLLSWFPKASLTSLCELFMLVNIVLELYHEQPASAEEFMPAEPVLANAGREPVDNHCSFYPRLNSFKLHLITLLKYYNSD